MKRSNPFYFPRHQLSCPSPHQQSLTSLRSCTTALRHFLCWLSTLPALSLVNCSALNPFSHAPIVTADHPLIRISERLHTTKFRGHCLSQAAQRHWRQLITASFFKNKKKNLLLDFLLSSCSFGYFSVSVLEPFSLNLSNLQVLELPRAQNVISIYWIYKLMAVKFITLISPLNAAYNRSVGKLISYLKFIGLES